MKLPGKPHRIILVVAIQIAILTGIAVQREWIMARGETVYLRTSPVDPRDAFRGDYIQLEYEISQPDTRLLPAMANQGYQTAYFSLERDRRGVAHLTAISTDRPTGLFIKGSLETSRYSWGNNTGIKLGIEKYFIEQGSGIALEEMRGRGQGWQTPMEMQVALGTDGTPVIKGFRWSDMGIRLEVLQPGQAPGQPARADADSSPSTSAPSARLSPALRISVRNQSDSAASFIDSEDHCGFTLAENSFDGVGGTRYTPVTLPNRSCGTDTVWQEHLLAPGDTYGFEIDMAEPAWQVEHDGKVMEIGSLPNNWTGYRWIYQLPESQQQAYAGRQDVWLSSLRTARFQASGRID